jgi:hypothetical protein
MRVRHTMVMVAGVTSVMPYQACLQHAISGFPVLWMQSTSCSTPAYCDDVLPQCTLHSYGRVALAAAT